MRVVPVYGCYTNGDIQGLTAEMVPEEDVIARAVLGATDYLLCMEKRLPTETGERMLKLLRENIPGQKGYILELWEKMEYPSRVQVIAKDLDFNAEDVKQRLLAELKSKGFFGL